MNGNPQVPRTKDQQFEPYAELREAKKLLKEARKIIQCHHRNLHKDWLQRTADFFRLSSKSHLS